MKEGVSVGPQITQLFQEQYFGTMLNSTERRGWKAFEKSAETFKAIKKEKIAVKLLRS